MRLLSPTALSVFLLFATGCAIPNSNMSMGAPGGPSTRPAHWAVPVARLGLPNLFRVSERLYRGAQPNAEGVRELAKLGVRTIVNLRAAHSDSDEIAEAGLEGVMNYVHIPMTAWNPKEEHAKRFLSVVADPSSAPVLVHCYHGADRTGMMVALYRVVVEGWSKERAIHEMKMGGYGFHPVWFHLPRFIAETDVLDLSR